VDTAYQPDPSAPTADPSSFLAAAAALHAMDDARRAARPELRRPRRRPRRGAARPPCCCWGSPEQLAGWDTGLIETALQAEPLVPASPPSRRRPAAIARRTPSTFRNRPLPPRNHCEQRVHAPRTPAPPISPIDWPAACRRPGASPPITSPSPTSPPPPATRSTTPGLWGARSGGP